MSNFEDYDLRRGSGRPAGRPTGRPTGRPASRPTGRPSQGRSGAASRTYNRSVDRSSRMSLDDELDLYEYGDEGLMEDELMYSASNARRSSGSRNGAHSSSGAHRSSHSSSHSGSSRSSHSSSNRRPSSSGRRPSSGKRVSGKKAKKAKMRRNIFVAEIVILLLLVVLFFIWNKIGKVNWDNINMDDIEVNNLDSATEELLSNYTTIALFGVDNRTNGNLDSGNSDTIMLVSINNDTKEVRMISVQRDTYLQITEGTYRKCNYAYNHGGVETAINMLNTNLDLNISGYVSVDFYALATIVDDLGGLDLEVTQRMIDTNNEKTGQNALAGYIAEVENVLKYYPKEENYFKMSDCYFDKPGTYHMNGAQVVGYCRNRYAVDNDYGRAENQRLVVKLIVEKLKKADLGTINKIADDVLPKISTSLSQAQCLGMAAAVKDYEITSSSGFPFALKTSTINKTVGSVVVPCTLTSNVTDLHKFLYDQEDYDPTDDMVDVISDHIKNETGFTEDSADIKQEVD